MKSYAGFALHSPRKIDFASIERAAHAANYTLKRIEIDVKGVVKRAPCAECGKDATFLELTPTGQLLEIEGDVPVGRLVRIRASVTSPEAGRNSVFSGGHVVLKVEEFSVENPVKLNPSP